MKRANDKEERIAVQYKVDGVNLVTVHFKSVEKNHYDYICKQENGFITIIPLADVRMVDGVLNPNYGRNGL